MDASRKREKKEKKRPGAESEPQAKQAKVAAAEEAPLPRGGGRVTSAARAAQEPELFTGEIAVTKNKDSGGRGGGEAAGKKSKRSKAAAESDEEDVTVPLVKHGRETKTVRPRNLTPGTLLLAVVAAAGPEDVDLELPHGLRATAEVSEIGEEVLASDVYAAGDEVAVCVTSAKPLRVSMDPELVCQFQTPAVAAAVEPGQAVVGRVASVEDRGWTVQVPHISKAAFLARSEVAEAMRQRLLVGRVLLLSVLAAPQGKKGLVQLSALKSGAPPKKDAVLSSVLPGMLLAKTILSGEARQPDDGYRVVFGRDVVGDIHWAQLPSRTLPMQPFKPTVPARVTWVDMDRGACGLSQLPWVVSRQEQPPALVVARPTVFKAKAVSSSSKRGVWLLAEDGTPTFCRPKLATDDEVPLESSIVPGAELACRLVHEGSFDGSLVVALSQSLLNAKWLLASEMRCGNACSGTVDAVRPNGSVTVSIEGTAEQLKGFVPPLHARDLKEGSRVSCRVWNPKPESAKHLPVLTTLKLLVRDKETPLSRETVAVGLWGSGIVQGVQDKFAIVGFYGGLEALLPLKQCSYSRVESVHKVLKIGQVVRARVMAVAEATGRVIVSLVEAAEKMQSSVEGLPPVASLVSNARVARVVAGSGFELLFGEDNVRGFLPVQHISDWPRLALAQAGLIGEGHVFPTLVVWGQDARRQQVICTAKQSYLTLREKLPRTLSELQDGSHIATSVIGKVHDKGLVVRVWQDLGLFCHRDRVSDAWVSRDSSIKSPAFDATLFKTMVGRVTGHADEKGKRTMRCGLSAQPADLGYLLQGYLEASRAKWPRGLEPATIVSGVVTEIGSSGVTLRLKGKDMMDYEARCGAQHAAAQGWRAGEAVRVAVVDVDPCSEPALLDVVPARVAEDNWGVVGLVLLVKDEVCILTSGVVGQLCIALAHPEWSQHCLTQRSPSPFSVGARLVVAPSEYEAATPKSWIIAASLSVAESEKDVAVSASASLQLGNVYELSVVSVAQHHMNVRKSSGEKGRIHLSELVEDDSGAALASLQQYKTGAIVRAVYVGYRKRKNKSVLVVSHSHQAAKESLNHHFSLRISRHACDEKTQAAVHQDTGHGVWLATVPVYGAHGVDVGSHLAGVVTEHSPNGLWVHVSPYLRGRLFMLDTSDDRDVVANLAEQMPVGTRLRVTVAEVDAEKRELDLLRNPPVRTVAEGATVLCRVNSFKGESALLQYESHSYARLHELDVDDVVHETGALSVLPEVGGFVYATLVKLPHSEFLDATTRPSVTTVPWGDGSISAADAKYRLMAWGAGLPAVGALMAGRVTSSGRGHDGVFVALGQHMAARCPLRLVSDEFVETDDVTKRFPAGMRVVCRVMSVDSESGRIEVALKASLCKKSMPLLTFDTVKVGQVVHCDVNKVDEKIGLFLTVRGSSNLSGLAHKSQIFDAGAAQDFTTVYEKGDYVVAKVLSLDKEKRRMGFTIKPSAFTAEEQAAQKAGSGSSESESEDESSGEEDHTGAGEELKAKHNPDVPSVIPSVGFFEDAEDNKVEDDDDSSSCSSAGGEKRKRERPATDAEVEERENLLAKRQAKPETDEDFERLLMGSPNSSEVWVRWMSHKLMQGDTDAARSVATRALLRISAQQPKERANVWTALVNLEVKYGTEASTDQLLVKGASEVGRFEMDCKCLDALERDTQRAARSEEFAAAMLKRHASVADCWLRVGQLFIRRGDGAKSGQVLQRAVKLVADKEARILMTSRWAQSEFREGSAERGRTIFFGLLDNYPKRIDIMVVFLDMEEKNKDWHAARELYKRATSLHLSSKKMRYFLRRWLEFEKQHGDERDVQLVTDTAKAFVESKTKKDDSE